nr:hypothetical protein [Allgaiera sp.]
QPHDYLAQYTVVSAATASGTGTAAITVSPAIIVQGTNDGTSTDANTVFGNATTAPANLAYVKFVGAPSAVLKPRSVFHKRAISLVSTRLQMPFTGTASYAVDPDPGIAVRYWRGSDISTGAHIHRWDCMYGGDVLDPSLGSRVTGFE